MKEETLPIYPLLFQAFNMVDSAIQFARQEPHTPEAFKIRMDIVRARLVGLLDPYEMQTLFVRRANAGHASPCTSCEYLGPNTNPSQCNGGPLACPGLYAWEYRPRQTDLYGGDCCGE